MPSSDQQRHPSTAAISVTSTTDGMAHAVLECEMATSSSGRYRATCGNLVIAGSVCEPDGRRCWACWPHEHGRPR